MQTDIVQQLLRRLARCAWHRLDSDCSSCLPLMQKVWDQFACTLH